MNYYDITEEALRTMNRYELEECVEYCNGWGRIYSEGWFSISLRDIRNLDEDYEMIFSEIEKREFNLTFFFVNSIRKFLDAFERKYFIVKSVVIYDLLRHKRNQTDFENFRKRISTWTEAQLNERLRTIDQLVNMGGKNGDSSPFSKKQLFELFVEELIIFQALDQLKQHSTLNENFSHGKASENV
jgi:hypothetical protein